MGMSDVYSIKIISNITNIQLPTFPNFPFRVFQFNILTDLRLNISIKHFRYLLKMLWVQCIAEDERAKTSRTSSHLVLSEDCIKGGDRSKY